MTLWYLKSRSFSFFCLRYVAKVNCQSNPEQPSCVSEATYPSGSHGFILGLLGLSTANVVHSLHKMERGLGRGDYVEWWGHCGTIAEVAHPQLAPCELPFNVRLLLQFG